ncbi:MAG TPA: hypothetical protein VE174_04990, partial [Actinomycetota bacterium]|nr:hypothetical protein [Actinomycetota bacterium]
MDRRNLAGIALAAFLIASFQTAGNASSGAMEGSLCPAGYSSFGEFQAEERAVFLAQHPEFRSVLSRDVEPSAHGWACISNKRPEEFSEIAGMQAEFSSRASAPFAQVPTGAFRNALRQRDRLIKAAPKVPGATGRWKPLGKGPLIVDDPRYDSVNGLGLSRNAGRIDSLDYDAENDRLFATIGTGGVWMSTNRGQSWRSIGDRLPFQTNGAVGWTKA